MQNFIAQTENHDHVFEWLEGVLTDQLEDPQAIQEHPPGHTSFPEFEEVPQSDALTQSQHTYLFVLKWRREVARVRMPEYEGLPSPFSIPYDQISWVSRSEHNRASGHGTEIEQPLSTLNCAVCFDQFSLNDIIIIPFCDHTFCKECLLMYVTTKLRERRFPIGCPRCLTDSASRNVVISDEIFVGLPLAEQDLDNLVELQLLQHSDAFTCRRCKNTIWIEKDKDEDNNILDCPLPDCRYRWCKSCDREVPLSKSDHRCKDRTLERLARKNGWKACPGCGVFVEKTEGCNHMVCRNRGCTVHFCFRCGKLIIDTRHQADISGAVSEHYARCVQYPVSRRSRVSCCIQ